MNYAMYSLGSVAICAMFLGAGVYLVVTEHYWWAWIPFLILCGVSFKPPSKPEPPEPKRVITPEGHRQGGG